jgi:hypothetical protein
MKYITLFVLACATSFLSFSQEPNAIDLSQDLLLSYKMNMPTSDTEKALGIYKYSQLVKDLDTDAKKQAFWMNMYIAYSQKMLNSSENGDCTRKCRKQKFVQIGSRVFSLNDVLYRFLLHSKCPATGMKRLFVPDYEKELRVSFPDGRVVLGIDSDPEITALFSYYEPEKVDQQLNEVSKVYIKKYVSYDATANVVYIPKWVRNFKRDFHHKAGMISGLKIAKVIPEDANPKIKFTDTIPTTK